MRNGKTKQILHAQQLKGKLQYFYLLVRNSNTKISPHTLQCKDNLREFPLSQQTPKTNSCILSESKDTATHMSKQVTQCAQHASTPFRKRTKQHITPNMQHTEESSQHNTQNAANMNERTPGASGVFHFVGTLP